MLGVRSISSTSLLPALLAQVTTSELHSCCSGLMAAASWEEHIRTDPAGQQIELMGHVAGPCSCTKSSTPQHLCGVVLQLHMHAWEGCAHVRRTCMPGKAVTTCLVNC
jgi:hypothetical protein